MLRKLIEGDLGAALAIFILVMFMVIVIMSGIRQGM
jgi:hypothetical protein